MYYLKCTRENIICLLKQSLMIKQLADVLHWSIHKLKPAVILLIVVISHNTT